MDTEFVGSRFNRALVEIYGEKNNRAIADKYGYTQQAIGKLKTKKHLNETICLISEKENINLNWLQTGDGDMFISNSKEKPLHTKEDSYEIDMLNVRAGAGEGIYNYEVEVIDKIVIDKAFFRTTPDINKVKIIEVDGDSMEPTLANGDYIIIDENKANKVDGIYAIQLDGQLLVKRLEFNLDNTVTIMSDNPKYSNKIYNPNETQIPFHILGMKTLSIQR